MTRASVIEQLQKRGVVAAHTEGRYVDMIRGVPVKAAFRLPIMMERETLRKGDKVAILSTDQRTAFICRVSKVEIVGTGTPVLELENQKLVKLD